MSRIVDLTGQVFGRLTVMSDTGERDKSGSVYWLCLCKCGKKVKVQSKNLKAKNTQSCGCLCVEKMRFVGGMSRRKPRPVTLAKGGTGG